MKGILHLLQPRGETLHFQIDDRTNLEMKNNMHTSYVDVVMPSCVFKKTVTKLSYLFSRQSWFHRSCRRTLQVNRIVGRYQGRAFLHQIAQEPWRRS